jgi:hypothetical protein
MALKKVQAAIILRWAVVAIGKAFSKLSFSPISLQDMLLVMGLGPRFCVFSS